MVIDPLMEIKDNFVSYTIKQIIFRLRPLKKYVPQNQLKLVYYYLKLNRTQLNVSRFSLFYFIYFILIFLISLLFF